MQKERHFTKNIKIDTQQFNHTAFKINDITSTNQLGESDNTVSNRHNVMIFHALHHISQIPNYMIRTIE